MRAGRRFRFRIGRRSCATAGVRGTRPFAKCAKERGTHCVGDGSKVKSLGHPAVCTISNEGAPSLRFLQGRVAVLPTRLLPTCMKPVAYTFVVPAPSQQTATERGTHFLANVSESKGRATPPRSIGNYQFVFTV